MQIASSGDKGQMQFYPVSRVRKREFGALPHLIDRRVGKDVCIRKETHEI